MIVSTGVQRTFLWLLLAFMVSPTTSQGDYAHNTTTLATQKPPTTMVMLTRSLSPEPPLTMVAGDIATIYFNYSGILEDDLILEVTIRDTNIVGFLGSNYTTMQFPLEHYYFDSIEIDLEARFIGITAIETKIVFLSASHRLGMEVGVPLEPYAVKVLRPYNKLNSVYNYVLLPLIVLNNIALGAKVEVKDMWGKIKKPLNMTVGAFCQFVLMPLITFTLAFLFQFDSYTAIGLLTVGCVPGDRLSTILTSVIDADLELSMAMTVIFAILALGITPLNMYVYSRPFVNRSSLPIHISIPFMQMFLQILALVVPLTLGLLISWKVSWLKKVLLKILKLLSVTCMITTLVLNMLTNRYVFASPPNLILCAFLVPFLGFNLAYLLARILRLRYIPAKTIGAETGIQNNILATAILRLSYPQPEADLLSRASILAIVASMADALVWIVVHYIRTFVKKRLQKRKQKKKKGHVSEDEPRMAPIASDDEDSDAEDFYTVSDIDEDEANYSRHHRTKKIDNWNDGKEKQYEEMRESNI